MTATAHKPHYSMRAGPYPERTVTRKEFRAIATECGWDDHVIELLLSPVFGFDIKLKSVQCNGELLTIVD